jgi:ribosomal protein S16
LFRDALPKLLPDMKLDGCSVWIKLLDIYIKKNPNKNLVISDVRFSDEAKYIQSIGGYIIKIDRKLEQPSDIAKHQSENQNVSYDIILNNNGSLDDLKKNIDTIAHVLQ